MLSAGATTAEIVKKLRVAKSYVYVVSLKMKNDKPTKAKRQVLDTNAQEWAKRNPWFGSGKDADLDKTSFALAVHDKVIRSGVITNSDKYYARVDAQMRRYDKEMYAKEMAGFEIADVKAEGSSIAYDTGFLDTTNRVSHPPHYTVGGIEVIDFIEAKKLGFNLGNVVKYVSRAGEKNDYLEDLQKARWYLERAIQRAE